MAPRLLLTGLAAAAVLCRRPWPCPGQSAPRRPAQRAVVVISDLHMGAGRDDAGRWRRDEDFRWSGEFAEFLRAIDSQHRSTVDLVLNGDTFELPSDEAGALASLDRVLAAHKAEVQALASFAKAGTNRIVLIPGDRDSALRFGKVAERVTRALGGSADRVDGRILGLLGFTGRQGACGAWPRDPLPHAGFRSASRALRQARGEIPGRRQRRHRSKRREVRACG